MSQQTTFLSLGCLTKRTRADRFLDEMNRVVPWTTLAEVVAPHYQSTGRGRPLTEITLLLRLHCLQLWYNLSDPGLEDTVHDRLSFQRFLDLDPLPCLRSWKRETNPMWPKCRATLPPGRLKRWPR